MNLSKKLDPINIFDREKRKPLKLHKMPPMSHNDFVDLYQQIHLEKGPLFESSLADHKESKWSFFSISPKMTITKTSDNKITITSKQGSFETPCFFNFIDSIKLKKSVKHKEFSQFPFIGGFTGFLSYENMFDTSGDLQSREHSFPLYQFSFSMNTFLFNIEKRECYLIYNDKTVLKVANHWREQKNYIACVPNKIRFYPQITKTNYLKNIQKIFEHIKKGDIYQANFSHKLVGQFKGNPLDIYNALRKTNPSPFSCYYEVNHQQFILCSSPERLFKVENGKIISSPIKGTIKRDSDETKDLQLQQELLNSQKNSAELAMIVDLIRNDIGKVSEFGTVKVLDYKKLETFKRVHHLVGTIEGKLKAKTKIRDIFTAIFPGGSITGAPKLKSIEILNYLEEQARGPYTGSMGYIDIRGNMDFNIMIRTILIDQNNLSLQVGGGIVIDSDPLDEYEETLHKAQALFDAISVSHP